ncbi:hypothetical protein [Rhizobium sp. NZLR1]|uniref:hypothetical protein n=1 Tax=Rhizobium sp. NZLR1 TaxID=2731096 RepID=UPI001A99EAD7|nr:hypothetical protein [Rhizobium sp. NZLR1]MBX5201023.1 hypothetical protein [Rhizobium sp. NZLR1]QSZ21546.1 hypothetical protein J3O30_02965 [Rhizobium sp. NZLR1]
MVKFSAIFLLVSIALPEAEVLAEEVQFDDTLVCGEAMAAPVPGTSATITSLSSTSLSSDGLQPGWDEFLNVSFHLIEDRIHSGASLVIATRMPFDDTPGALRNPGCFSRSKNYVMLAEGLLEFAFLQARPERSASAIGVTFHELGHAFQQRKAPKSMGDGSIEDYLYAKSDQGIELFSDYFAGFMFLFWRRYVEDHLNIKNPLYHDLLVNLASFDNFRFTFRYFGCYQAARSIHGDYRQRHDAFVLGALDAEKVGVRSLDDVTDDDLDAMVMSGAVAVLRISTQPHAKSAGNSCMPK